MNKTYLVLILLLNVCAGLVGMQSNSWVFKGLSQEDLHLFNTDLENGSIAVELINRHNSLEEKKIANRVDFSAQDCDELTETKDFLDDLGLGYFVLIREMKKSYQKPSDILRVPLTKTANPKVRGNLMDRFSSSSSSSEEERKEWKFVNFIPEDVSGLESSSEECDYTGHDRLNMIAWSSNFSTK